MLLVGSCTEYGDFHFFKVDDIKCLTEFKSGQYEAICESEVARLLAFGGHESPTFDGSCKSKYTSTGPIGIPHVYMSSGDDPKVARTDHNCTRCRPCAMPNNARELRSHIEARNLNLRWTGKALPLDRAS